MKPVEKILERLSNIKKSGSGWLACCPAHDDQKQSLSINEGNDNKVLLHCHAGCDTNDILKALDLNVNELFQEKDVEKTVAAVYDYKKIDNELIYQVIRYFPKDFRQRRPDGNGGWLWNMKDIKALPYKLPEVLAALKSKETVFIVEGEKDVQSLTRIGLVATCNHGGAGKWREEHSKYFPASASVVIIPDNDVPGKKHAEQVAHALTKRSCRVRVIELPGLPPKGDISDWLAKGNTKERLIALVNNAREWGQVVPRLKVLTAHELILAEIPPREEILSPWMLSQSLSMIHAWRGTGKTHVSLGIAYAVASGGKFLNWTAHKPRGVLFIDGEMPAIAIQERLAAITKSSDSEPEPEYLRFLSPDFNKLGMPDLGSLDGQAEIDGLVLPSTELIVIDNLSSLVRSGRENEAEGWQVVQAWALRHRAAGRSVLFIHHSGKGGQQRGTSKKEDLLDAVISLKRPADYQPNQGARFELTFEKARHLYGQSVDSLDCQLITDEKGRQGWTIKPVSVSTYEKVLSLAQEGLNGNEIAQELDINKSTVSRYLKKGKQEGIIVDLDSRRKKK